MTVFSDIVTRLRHWTHPASDLMHQAAHEIVELRRQVAVLREERHHCRTLHVYLSDEERRSIEVAVRIIVAYEDEMDGFTSHAATALRGLLERHK